MVKSDRFSFKTKFKSMKIIKTFKWVNNNLDSHDRIVYNIIQTIRQTIGRMIFNLKKRMPSKRVIVSSV